MAEEVVRLVVEVDASKAGPATARMRQEFTANVRAMDAESKKAQAGVTGIGQGAQQASKVAAGAMRAMSAGIGAATAAAAAQQRSWLALGTTILGTFAAGGPVAGGIALVGAAFGLLAGDADRAAERMKAAFAGVATAANEIRGSALALWGDTARAGMTELERVRDDAAKASEAARRAREAFANPLDSAGAVESAITSKQAEIERLSAVGTLAAKTRIKEIEAEKKELEDLYKIALRVRDLENRKAGFERQGLSARVTTRQLDEASALLRSGGAQIRGSLGDRAAAATAAEADARAREDLANVREAIRLRGLGADSLRQAEALQRTFNGEKADEVRLEQEIVELEAQVAALSRLTSSEGKTQAADAQAILDAKRALLGVTRTINAATAARDMQQELAMMRAITDEERAQVALQRDLDQKRRAGWTEAALAEFAALRNRQPIVDFARSLTDTIRGSLTDAIVDGLSNGFDNGWDIARSFIDQMQRQLIGSLVGSLTSGLPSLLTGLLGGGGGGGFGGAASTITSVVGAFTGGGTASVSGAGFSPLPSLDTGFT